MALVPSSDTDSATSSCCRLFYEAKINGLTVRRMIFKNIKRLSPQTGLLENRPFLSENGRYLTAKEIKPDSCIQTDKIEIENQSRRRRSSSNLGLTIYKTLPNYHRILDKLNLSKLPPTISASVNSNLMATVTLFDNAVTKQITTEAATKHKEKKQSMQMVVKKEPSYEEITDSFTTDGFLNLVKRSRSESANTSGSRTSPQISDHKKFQKLQSQFIQERDHTVYLTVYYIS